MVLQGIVSALLVTSTIVAVTPAGSSAPRLAVFPSVAKESAASANAALVDEELHRAAASLEGYDVVGPSAVTDIVRAAHDVGLVCAGADAECWAAVARVGDVDLAVLPVESEGGLVLHLIDVEAEEAPQEELVQSVGDVAGAMARLLASSRERGALREPGVAAAPGATTDDATRTTGELPPADPPTDTLEEAPAEEGLSSPLLVGASLSVVAGVVGAGALLVAGATDYAAFSMLSDAAAGRAALDRSAYDTTSAVSISSYALAALAAVAAVGGAVVAVWPTAPVGVAATTPQSSR